MLNLLIYGNKTYLLISLSLTPQNRKQNESLAGYFILLIFRTNFLNNKII